MSKATSFNLKPFIIGAVLFVVIAIGIYLYSIYRKKQTAVLTNNDTVNDKKMVWGNDSFPLKLSSKGERVKYLQAGLNIAYNSRLNCDGKLGEKTVAVLKEHTGFDTVSESAYKDIIESRMPLIEKYLKNLIVASSASKPPAPGSGTYQPSAESISKGVSVKAISATTGYLGDVSDDKYVITSTVYKSYSPGEYVGVVVGIQDQWIICITPNDDIKRVYILKTKVSPLK